MSEISSTSNLFGRYQLLDPIAVGGMAEVFRAKQDGAAGTEKLVCIKRILPALSRNSDFIRLFVQEAKIVLPLTHGNITQVYDFGEVDGIYFMAMEYVRGQNLAQVLARLAETGKALDVSAALWIASEVCRGLQYAHGYTDGKGRAVAVVHRDVTPHNVLLSYNGEVKLTDFGIALAASRAQGEASVVRGKPCYLAPEQLDGEAGDPRSDIFALGATLYEMLTGTRPFAGDSDSDTLQKVRTFDPKPPSTINSAVSAELDGIVLKALRKDRTQRYQRSSDLQVELGRVLHGDSGGAFTADDLAGLLKDLFAWELNAAAGGDSNDAVRDRLLFQLSRAGVAVGDSDKSTDDLLQMGTVAIEAGRKPMSSGSGARLTLPAALIGLLVLLGGAAAVSWVLGKGTTRGGADGGEAPVVVPPQPATEHLTPTSLRPDHQKNAPIPALPSDAQPAKVGAGTPSTAPTSAPSPRVGRPAHLKRAPTAFLNCNSWPWSVVYLNGRRLEGNTPLYGVKVFAGRHTLRFVNPELKLSKEVTVSVPAGRIKTVAVRLQD